MDTSRLPAGLVVVEVRGEVTGSFFTLMRRTLESPPESVLIDLTRVNFFCADGIAALMELRRHCAATAVTLRLVAPRPVRRPLELVGLADLFTLSTTVDDAITEVGTNGVTNGVTVDGADGAVRRVG